MKITKYLLKSVLVLIGVLFVQTLFSQENFLSGYIIDLKGDTLHGLLDYRNWDCNPTTIRFKAANAGDPIVYKPLDLIEFSVSDEVYVSAIVKAETSPNKIDQLQEDPNLKFTVDTTFLQSIFQGDKCLYYYKNTSGKENFYIKYNGDFELLIYKRYLRNREGQRVIVENKKYIGQLSLYLNNCSSIQSKIEDVSYNLKGLKNIFQFYFKNSKSEIVFQRKMDKTPIEIGIIAWASINSLKFSSANFAYLVNANFDKSTNFTTGLFFDIILPRKLGKWSINNELLFSSYKSNGHYLIYEHKDNYSINNFDIGFSYLKVNNLVRFKYPIGFFDIFINAGISNGLAITESNYRKEESKFYTQERVDESKALDDIRKYEQGYIIGTGIKHKKYSCEIRYEKANGMSEYIALKAITTKYFFILGYKF